MREKRQFNLRGCGPVGAFGAGMDALAAATAGSSVSAEEYSGPGEREFLAEFEGVLKKYLPSNKLRRVDRFGRLALTALFLCLDDAGIAAEECVDYGLIIASGFGPAGSSCQFKDTLIDNGFLGASPTAFTKSVHNQAAAHIAMHLGLHGPVATLCQQWFPVQSAMQLGCMWLIEQRVKSVLVGVLDEWIEFFSFCQNVAVDSSGGHAGSMNKGTAYFAGDGRKAEGAAFFLIERGDEHGRLRLSMPELAISHLSDYLHDCDKIIGTGPFACRDNRLDSADIKKKFQVFRDIYGAFPTAAGLDLCALAGGLAAGEAGSCFESGIGGEYSLIRLDRRNSVDCRRGMA